MKKKMKMKNEKGRLNGKERRMFKLKRFVMF